MKRAVLTVLALIILAAAAVAGYWLWEQRQLTAFADKRVGDGAPKVVEIPNGTGPRQLARLLETRGVVSNADQFFAWIRREKLAPKLRSGEYEFPGAVSPRQVVDMLSSGQVKQYHFTVPEGLRVDEILPILSSSELHLDAAKLQTLASDPAFVRKAGVPAPATTLEGFLYPDTYTFTRPFSEESVLLKMVSRALEEYRKADTHRKPGVKLDLLETMTLASIVEKETAAVEERPRISCVFHQRLRLRWPLGTDPTVLYAKMLWSGSWSKNITRADLTHPHPYNTYVTLGLPPGPIASAGAAAIRAALEPIDCHDLFFVSRNNGTHVFCPDLKCHNAAVKKWQIDYFKHPHATAGGRRGTARESRGSLRSAPR